MGRPIPGLVVGRTLVNTDGPVVAVKVINVSTEPRTTGRGTKVADCTPVINVVEVKDENIWPHRPRRESLERYRNWPDPICKMVNWSSADLEIAQWEALHKLIEQHLGIFSLSPEDIGRTGLVKHQIHTGEARPICQPARWLPWIVGQITAIFERNRANDDTSIKFGTFVLQGILIKSA